MTGHGISTEIHFSAGLSVSQGLHRSLETRISGLNKGFLPIYNVNQSFLGNFIPLQE